MKRYLIFILALALLFCTACGSIKADTPTDNTQVPSNPASAAVPTPEPEFDWGITLTLENLTRSGAVIVCAQTGGDSVAELSTGSYFILEQLTENGWKEVQHTAQAENLAWTAEAWLIQAESTTEWTVSWEWIYGQLADGHYRIGKEFANFRGPGNRDTMMVYAEFTLLTLSE